MTHKLSGAAFRFHLIGTLAALRAVQHALRAHDRKLSPQHNVRAALDWCDAELSKLEARLPDIEPPKKKPRRNED